MAEPPPWLLRTAPFVAAAICLAVAIGYVTLMRRPFVHSSNPGFVQSSNLDFRTATTERLRRFVANHRKKSSPAHARMTVEVLRTVSWEDSYALTILSVPVNNNLQAELMLAPRASHRSAQSSTHDDQERTA